MFFCILLCDTRCGRFQFVLYLANGTVHVVCMAFMDPCWHLFSTQTPIISIFAFSWVIVKRWNRMNGPSPCCGCVEADTTCSTLHTWRQPDLISWEIFISRNHFILRSQKKNEITERESRQISTGNAICGCMAHVDSVALKTCVKSFPCVFQSSRMHFNSKRQHKYTENFGICQLCYITFFWFNTPNTKTKKFIMCVWPNRILRDISQLNQ